MSSLTACNVQTNQFMNWKRVTVSPEMQFIFSYEHIILEIVIWKFCRSLRVGGCRWVQRLSIVCWTPCFQSQSSCIQQLKGHGTYFVILPLQLFLRNRQWLNCTKRHEVTTMVSTVQDPICKNVEHLVLHMMKIAPAEIWTDVLVKLFQNLNCSCTNQEKECCY